MGGWAAGTLLGMRSPAGPVRVLVLGQSPPPFHGQSLMIEAMLRHPMAGVELRHVRMAYSREMEDIGRLAMGKLLHMFGVTGRALWSIARFRPDVVYYPPCGPNFIPATRDVFTLLAIRPFSRRLVLHFHAGGISELKDRRWPAPLIRRLFVRAFARPDAAVMLAPTAPPDGQRFEAERLYYVANGVADEAGRDPERRPEGLPEVLFVGVLLEAKGVLLLTRAAARLWRAGRRFRLVFVGRSTPEVAASIRAAADGFEDRIELTGVLTGKAKWDRFARASSFCYPTNFDSEVMPIACLEAMSFGLPVVATRWRGVPDIVEDGVTGFLVPIQDEEAVASKLDALLEDDDLRGRMGAAARRRFEERFTIEAFIERMRAVFLEVAGSARR
jgi:glycosyltransferase involved in cell wall biosynthesis